MCIVQTFLRYRKTQTLALLTKRLLKALQLLKPSIFYIVRAGEEELQHRISPKLDHKCCVCDFSPNKGSRTSSHRNCMARCDQTSVKLLKCVYICILVQSSSGVSSPAVPVYCVLVCITVSCQYTESEFLLDEDLLQMPT